VEISSYVEEPDGVGCFWIGSWWRGWMTLLGSGGYSDQWRKVVPGYHLNKQGLFT
jgi:hypothetical protein